jgi:hypothetical protein
MIWVNCRYVIEELSFQELVIKMADYSDVTHKRKAIFEFM